MLSILAAASIAATSASAADVEIKQLSEDFWNLEIAEFEKKMPFKERHELQAERLAKKAGCNFQGEAGWVHIRVDVALEVTKLGQVAKVVPVETGCPELENYVISHFEKYAGSVGAVKRTGSGKWYRQSMTFRWPE